MPSQQIEQHAWKRDSVGQEAAVTREELEKQNESEAMRLRGGCVSVFAHLALLGAHQ